ncbi:MAG: heparin lyase I family protein [Lacunisphaera sp.]|nr:heparin lyase I family protein [Lacunisphaera sp.]
MGQALFHADYNPISAGGTGDASVMDHAGPLAVLQQHFHPGRAGLLADGQETPLVAGRPAGGMLRFETRQEDGNFAQTKGNRSELRLDKQPMCDARNHAPLEMWYGWSLFVPAPTDPAAAWDGGDNAYPKPGRPKNDGDGGGREIYFQVHAPDKIPLDGNPENPPLAFRRVPDSRFPRQGRLELNWRWDMNHPGSNESADLGAFPLGQWTDFVLRVVWTDDPAGRGSIELWQNGWKVVDQQQRRVGYRNMESMYLKVGIYAFDWNFSPEPDLYRALAYYDELRLHQGSFPSREAGYLALKPRRE